MTRKLMTLVTLAVLLVSVAAPAAFSEGLAGQPASSSQSDRIWQDEVIYFIIPDRFKNGDKTNDFDYDPDSLRGYHGGDLQGIIDELDYIESLGATAIWMTPVVENQTGGYHGYWATDFYKMDKRLGSLEKLKELVDRAQARGMKVILDVVVNHTGYTHPWLTDPAKASWFHPEAGISDWNNQLQIENGWLAGLPDLDQDNPEVAQYLIDYARWWIEQTGVDGFRLDTVRHVPKEFWRRFSKEMKQTKPGFFLLGEVWNKDISYIAEDQATGIDAMVDFANYYAMKDVFGKGRPVGQLLSLWEAKRQRLSDASLSGLFIDNHDVPRFVTDNPPEGPVKLRLAAAYIMTTPGIPIIYYGTEVGMKGGNDPSNRQSMKFGDNPELLAYFQTLGKLRQEHVSLRRGDMIPLPVNDKVLAYARAAGEDRLIVTLNNGRKEESVEIDLPETVAGNGARLENLLSPGEVLRVKDGQVKVTLDPKEPAIWLVKRSSGRSLAMTAGIPALLVIGLALLFVMRRRRA